MFRKIKEWFQQERNLRSASTLDIFQGLNDPRELPRPNRYFSNKLNSDKNILDNNIENKAIVDQCNCKNCCEITDNFAECIVCMDPLQCAAISSCMFCGNYTCWNCSEKVTHCPFCRANFSSKENRIRNFALERVLLKLELPCKHSRWGCKMLLNHKERASHETSCPFAPTGCPLVKLCGWNGDTTNIIRHLKDTHDMTLIAANGINIEIADFQMKFNNTITIPRLYTVSLTCHENIYICKLKMVNQKLRFIFFQITGESSQKDKKFGAFIEISTATRTLTGTVEISPKHRNNKEIVIPGQAFIYSSGDGDDLLKISITIKPLC